MKFILLGLLIFMGHTFAATELEKKLEFITTKALSAKNLETPKVPEALKSLRHFKHRKSHDHFTKNKMIAKKEKRQFKILNFIEDLKNEFGPVSVESIDSEDPNKLKFKVEGKTPHFSITEVKFKIAAPDERFSDKMASVAVVDSEIVTVDISLIEPGEYKLALYIKYKLGANQKISLLRVSKSVFEKLYTESAHANLVEVSFNSSRVELDMSGSYSDFGNITSYSVKTFKDGEVLSVDTFDPSVDGTIITESFLLKGIYQLELTVVDEFGDSDSVMSSEYVIENAAPSISFSVNQNEEYTNIFDIDVSQISVDQGELESVSIEVYSDNGGSENYYFPAADLFDSIKTIKTNLTGNIQIGVYAISQAGIDNFVMAPQGYIIDSPKASLFLRYSHSFISEGLSPYVKAYAFLGEDYLSDFDYFEVTITNEAGETSVYQQNDPYLSEGFIHAEVFYNSPGIYDASIVMVQKNGTRSLAFETRERFIEVDLGVANLAMDLDFQNPETSRDLRWIVNLDESSAGNYGYFENFSCEFRDKLSDNEFVIEKEWTEFYFTIERGDYDVSCIGKTTAGLTSQNELKFSIDATNRAPQILNVDYFLVDTTWLEHHAYIEHNDPDGWIDYLIVKERYSNGVEHEYTVYDFISFSAIDLPLGTGSVDIELIAVDDEGEESEPYQFSVNFNNNAPEFDINIAAIDPLLRSYKIDFQATDDGYIENYQFVATDPDGHKHTYDFYETVDYTFWMAGTWNIEVTVFDNFGKPSTKNLGLTIENSLPNVLSLTIDDLSNRRYRITPASQDLDGYIVFDELIVSNPRGESETYQLGEQSIELDFQTPGLYQLSYRVKDQDGAWSEAYLSSVEVINQIPVADFEISQISQNRFFLTSINSYDLDGEIVEFKTQFYGPNGEYIERFDANDFDIQLEAAGSWEVAHSVIDNDGASSDEKRISVEVINIAPTIELSYLEVDPATRTYQISAEISEDYGYYNTFVKITDPQGGINEFGTGFPFEYQLESAGTWTVEGRIVDQDGVEVLNTIAIEVINQAPTIELSYELLDQETKRYRFSANVSDDFGQPTTYLKLTSPEGVVEEFETSFPVERELNIVGIWNVEARVVDVEGVSDLSLQSITVREVVQEVSVGAISCVFERDNKIRCDDIGVYKSTVQDRQWSIDGSSINGKEETVFFDVTNEDTYSIQLSATEISGNVVSSQYEINVEFIYENEESEINIGHKKTDTDFHSLDEDFVVTVDKEFLDQESYLKFVVQINSVRVDLPSWSTFNGEISIPADLQNSGLNEIVIGGYDYQDNEIDYEVAYFAGQRSLEVSNQLEPFTRIFLKSLDAEVPIKRLFEGRSTVSNIPAGKYFIQATTSSSVFSDIIDLSENDYERNLNLASMIASSETDQNFENGIEGWYARQGTIDVLEDPQSSFAPRKATLKVGISGIGHLQKLVQVGSSKKFVNYNFRYLREVGDTFFVGLTNIDTGVSNSYISTSGAGGAINDSIMVPADFGEKVIVEIFLKRNSVSTVKKGFGIINSAYANDSSSESDFSVVFHSPEISLSHLRLTNLPLYSRMFRKSNKKLLTQISGDFRPTGISIGSYEPIDFTGSLEDLKKYSFYRGAHGVTPANPFHIVPTRFGDANSEIDISKIVDKLVVRFDLIRIENNLENLLERVEKRANQKLGNSGFEVYLTSNDFEDYHESDYPDFFRVSVCMEVGGVVLEESCHSFDKYRSNGNTEDRKFLVFNEFYSGRTYSRADSLIGGDRWAHNKLIPNIEKSVNDSFQYIRIGDLSAVNGGYWADHHNGGSGSHLYGDTLDFVPTTEGGSDMSLRTLNNSLDRIFIQKTTGTYNSLLRVLTGNNFFLTKHAKKLLGPSNENIEDQSFFSGLEQKCIAERRLFNETSNSTIFKPDLFHNDHFHIEIKQNPHPISNKILAVEIDSLNSIQRNWDVDNFGNRTLKGFSHSVSKINESGYAELAYDKNFSQDTFVKLRNLDDSSDQFFRKIPTSSDSELVPFIKSDLNEQLGIIGNYTTDLVKTVVYEKETGACFSREIDPDFGKPSSFSNQVLTQSNTPDYDRVFNPSPEKGMYFTTNKRAIQGYRFSPFRQGENTALFGGNWAHNIEYDLNNSEYGDIGEYVRLGNSEFGQYYRDTGFPLIPITSNVEPEYSTLQISFRSYDEALSYDLVNYVKKNFDIKIISASAVASKVFSQLQYSIGVGYEYSLSEEPPGLMPYSNFSISLMSSEGIDLKSNPIEIVVGDSGALNTYFVYSQLSDQDSYCQTGEAFSSRAQYEVSLPFSDPNYIMSGRVYLRENIGDPISFMPNCDQVGF